MQNQLATERQATEVFEDGPESLPDLLNGILAEFDKYGPSAWRPREKAMSLIAVLADSGYRIVPIETTAAMLEAYAEYRRRRLESNSPLTIEGIWDAMINAAARAVGARAARRG